MKKITTYLLQIAGIMVLCSAMASCRLDDLFDDGEGSLPPGSHPLSFVASVGSLNSRSEGKNSWEENDQIGVRTINLKGRKYSMIGRYSLNKEGMMKDVVKRYSVGQDGTWNEYDQEPLEWPYPKGKVSAWFPFDAQVDVPLDNQAEKGFDHLDFLSVITDEKEYKNVVDLNFQHRMAKVTCLVIPDDGITPEEYNTLWLRLQGHTSCTFRETELTGGDNIGWIIPDSTNYTSGGTLYEALLVPNEMAGKDLISIGLKTNYDGNIIPKHFSCPSPKIEGGMHYKYYITVKKDRFEVSFFTVEWEDEGAGQHEPARFTFRVNLGENFIKEINLRNPLTNTYEINSEVFELVGDVTPIRNNAGLIEKLDVTGNEFTIKVTTGPDTRPYNLVVKDSEATNNTRIVNDNGRCYKENNVFLIADETTLDYRSELNVGDYFFSDGSWSSDAGWNDVQCVGVVFAVNNGNDPSVFKLTDSNGNEYVADQADDYTNNPIKNSNRIRGYVLALTDATRDYTLYKKGLKYSASTLQRDIQVSWAETDTVYEKGTKYPKGKLIRDLKVVSGGTETLYEKGTEYNAGALTEDLHVVWTAMDNVVYTKNTNYDGGTLISDVKLWEKVEKFPWSPLEGASACIGAVCSFDTDLFNGYANMVSVKEKVGTQCGGSVDVPPFDKLEALAEAEAYPVKAPEGTSGWYLPSIKQLQTALDFFHQYDNNKLESPIMKAAGIFPNEKYWSSTIGYRSGTMAPGFNAYTYDYNTTANPVSMSQIIYSSTNHVRAVLTF